MKPRARSRTHSKTAACAMTAPRSNSKCMREGVERRFETRIVLTIAGGCCWCCVTLPSGIAPRTASARLAFLDPLTRAAESPVPAAAARGARREASTTGERFAVVRINSTSSSASTTAWSRRRRCIAAGRVPRVSARFLKLERDGAVTMPLARLTGDEFAVAIRHLESEQRRAGRHHQHHRRRSLRRS